MDTGTADIVASSAGGIATIALNRPARKNAITAPMYQALADALRAAGDDATIRCIVIHGTPEVFTAGNDLEDFLNDPPLSEDSPVFRFLTAIAGCTKPLVAAVTGPAVGVGTTMLLHCDLVYAADNARFALPFAPLGLCPEAASSLLLPMLAGHQRAAEKLLLGEPFGAEEAREMGLVNKVLPAAQTIEHALAQAAKLVRLPASSLRVTKRLMRQGLGAVIAQRMLDEGAEFRTMLTAAEAREAFSAFLEKRKPDFSRFG
ncbi:MAG: enoyl-CoA hydratase [Burkholderiaceae bacterium]|nr:enoyl-CoA hydratase [Burkholderiaceae bacterium]